MYYVKRKVKKNKLKNIGNIKGLEIKPKKKEQIDKIIIIDSEMSNNYIKKILDRKFKNMYKKIYEYLMEDEGSEDGIKACLSEIEKLKSLIFYKYQEYMKVKLYKEYLAKIVLTTEELKNKDMERNFFNQIMRTTVPNYYDTEEEIRGKSR